MPHPDTEKGSAGEVGGLARIKGTCGISSAHQLLLPFRGMQKKVMYTDLDKFAAEGVKCTGLGQKVVKHNRNVIWCLQDFHWFAAEA